VILATSGLTLVGTGAVSWIWSHLAQEQAQWMWDGSLTPNKVGGSEKEPPYPAAVSSLVLLSCPRLNQRLYVLPGTANLKRGPALVEATSRPGEKGNCVIAGHRDTHFRFLKYIRAGDDLYLERSGRKYRYRVTSTYIINPTNMKLLRPDSTAVLTLVTCYPFHYLGSAPQRFIVRAELLADPAG
jgi:sortase A